MDFQLNLLIKSTIDIFINNITSLVKKSLYVSNYSKSLDNLPLISPNKTSDFPKSNPIYKVIIKVSKERVYALKI